MGLNMLAPMIDNNSKKLIFMDFIENKTYELELDSSKSVRLVEISKDESDDCFKDVRKQQEDTIQKLPIEEISRMIEREKVMSEKSKMNISGIKSL